MAKYHLKRVLWATSLFIVSSLWASPTTSHVLWYNGDAGTEFTNALPIGNGNMGGMVYGAMGKDIIGLNESSVWNSGPGDNNKAGAADKLPAIRNALFSGDYGTAENLTGSLASGNIAAYQPVGDLVINVGHNGTDYRRELDLSTAIAKTTYKVDGVTYTREYFASHPDNVMVIRISASEKGKVGFSAGFTTPHTNKSIKNVGTAGLTLDGTIQAIKFQGRMYVTSDGGSVSAGNGTVDVTGANSAVIILNIASNFKSYNDVSGDPAAKTDAAIAAAAKKSFDELKANHLKDYQELFNRVRLNLGEPASNAGDITTSRVKNFNSSNDPSFVELYYNFGRYLMIACSRAGGQPANLQGIWNKDTSPVWGSKYTTNINLEMNYWMIESANLQECGVPLFDKIKGLVPQGQLTAKVHWGSDKGWVLHHNTDLWNRTAPVDGSWGVWPTGAGWLVTHLWEHYLFTGDKDFLKDVYFALKGAAEFFLNTLVEEPVSGNKYLVTAPSDSPENTHGPYNVCFGPTMDNQIIRDVFNYTIEASKVLGVDDNLRAQMEAAVKRLPPNKIGQHKQLMEWFEDWDDPRSEHRHVSHLYGLFPSSQISLEDTKEIAEAAKTSLTQRGDAATGWSLAWKINLWARLQDGDHAYTLVRNLLTPDRTYNNLFDAHPPFQIDGNFGAVSGINEMLLQSQGGKIRILPALPSKWADGTVAGLRARGGIVVDSMAWKGGKLTYLKISSELGSPAKILYNGKTVTVPTKKGSDYEFDGNLKQLNQVLEPVTLPAKIEAEDYIAMEGVEIETEPDGSSNLGYINDGDFAEYLVNSPAEAIYTLRVTAGTGAETVNEINVKDSTGAVLATLKVDPAKSTGWKDFYEVETSIKLSKGPQKLKFEFNGESDFLLNVDNITFESAGGDAFEISAPRVNTLEVSRVPMSRASVALMVKAPAGRNFTVHLLDMDGRLVAQSNGVGSAYSNLVEFGTDGHLPQGNYIAVVRSGTLRKTLRLSSY